MSILRILFRLILVLTAFYFFLFFIIPFCSFRSINSTGKQLVCKNSLQTIANTIKLYQDDWEGQWPESLAAMKTYYDPPNRIPQCPGERNEDETSTSADYIYFPPKVEGIVPVCWDSKPHYNKILFIEDFPSNVLYSDGHIENLSERELFRELFPLAKTNSDILKVLNYPKTQKISKFTLFIIGIVIGVIFALCYRFVTKK